jgi:hypothetical protein
VLALLKVCKQETISVPIGLLADHTGARSDRDATYNWFFRNNWHQVVLLRRRAGHRAAAVRAPAAPIA